MKITYIPKYSLHVVSLALARGDTILSVITEMITIKTYNSKIKSETKYQRSILFHQLYYMQGFSKEMPFQYLYGRLGTYRYTFVCVKADFSYLHYVSHAKKARKD